MSAPSDTRREAFRFFSENAGGIVGHCAEGALALARAEQLLADAEELDVARLEWVDDPEPYDHGIFSPDEIAEKFESNEWTGPFGCVVRVGDPDEDADAVASLWGIVLGPRGIDDPYARVVAAELADELEDDLRQAVGDARDAERLRCFCPDDCNCHAPASWGRTNYCGCRQHETTRTEA